MSSSSRPLAVVTGASAGIGLELARQCADKWLRPRSIAADHPDIEQVATQLDAQAVQADLSGPDGVARLCDAIAGRKVDALLANAGRGLGKGFLDQDEAAWRKVVDTNITGTLLLLQRVGQQMKAAGSGRILITGSIAGFMPGTYQAVYNGTKAFLDSFSFALRHELKDSGVTVTCLMPGATETDFFETADMMDTKVGQAKKDDPAMVAKKGFDAMMNGEGDVVTGWHNKLQAALAHVLPAGVTAELHRTMAQPQPATVRSGRYATIRPVHGPNPQGPNRADKVTVSPSSKKRRDRPVLKLDRTDVRLP